MAARYRWLQTGEEALAAMFDAITAARESVRFETYIYEVSPIGEKFLGALAAAQRRGVRVQVMIDALGSLFLSTSFWKPLIDAGGEFKFFNRLGMRRLGYRNHRKMLVCDGTIAFVGGFNLATVYDGDGVTRGWRDLGMQITGPLAVTLAEAFDALFTTTSRRRFKLLPKRKPVVVGSGQNWQLLISGFGRHGWRLRKILATDIAAARDVKIISAYFLPTWRIRSELRRVAKRGGRVQLILAGKTDVKLSQLASRRLYRGLMRHGVEIYEYQPQILHAKLYILDDIVCAGSANLDTRSLVINHELLVRIKDAQLASEARQIFEGDLQHSLRIDPATWRKSRTFAARLIERWAYFLLARVDPWLSRVLARIFRHWLRTVDREKRSATLERFR